MWAKQNGGMTEQQTFDRWYNLGGQTFWAIPPGKPGVADLFANPVYVRGGMTLQALRMTIGDDAFFAVLRTWAAEHADGNVTTAQFVALAERISGKQLGQLFQDWLYGTTRPARP
jgi:aminopeptidase N